VKNINWKFLVAGFLVFVVSGFMPAYSFANVDVYLEGAYTETDLAVYIYANTNGTELRSAGVKLTYDPSELTVTSAVKNEADWYLGSESYMDPETGTAGEVVIILGKLDEAIPEEGVSGDRVLLGRVCFARNESSMPFAPTLGLELGKLGPEGKFANFVDTADPANVLDDTGVTFGSMTVAERGDANADGRFTPRDINAVKSSIGVENPPCYADCNGSCEAMATVTPRDINCVKSKIQ
jgi:hypothetical protein